MSGRTDSAAQDRENALVYALRHIIHWPYDVMKTPEEDLREIKDFAERTLEETA